MESYFASAEQWIDRQWSVEIEPILTRHPIDYSLTVDLGCGQGRNIPKLLPLAGKVIGLDVNPELIDLCNKRFATEKKVICEG